MDMKKTIAVIYLFLALMTSPGLIAIIACDSPGSGLVCIATALTPVVFLISGIILLGIARNKIDEGDKVISRVCLYAPLVIPILILLSDLI